MATKVLNVRMTVDALHIIEIAAQEADTVAVKMGLCMVFNFLQKAAKRATELNDPELNYIILHLGLYDVPDINKAIAKVERLIAKQKGLDGNKKEGAA